MMSECNGEALAAAWQDMSRRFKKKTIDCDFKTIVLKHTNERRSDACTHNIHSYPAKMFPYIPIFLYSIPQLCPPDGTILDPFCGSGTTLIESIIHPIFRRNVYGVEINPLGRLVAKVKTTPIPPEVLRNRTDSIAKQIKKPDKEKYHLPKSKKINFWFSQKAIIELCRIKHAIEEDDVYDDFSDFMWVCFSSIIRKVSLADPFIPPPVLLKLSKYENSKQKYEHLKEHLRRAREPDLTATFLSTVEKNLERIDVLDTLAAENSKPRAQIIWDDARHIGVGRLGKKGALIKDGSRSLSSNSIDLILTSPPYLSAQKYVRTLTLELLWLDVLSELQIAQLDKETIGTERVALKETDFSITTGVESVDRLVKWASSKSRERAAIILRYFLEMKKTMIEMYRVLKNESYAVLVVGNNEVLGKKVKTYSLLIDAAESVGFKLELVLKDRIRGRGMITRRHNTGGLIEEEYIVVLKKN
jgi:DNA modification methylase